MVHNRPYDLVWPAEDCPPKLGLDEACLKVINKGVSEVYLYEQLYECYSNGCEGLLWKTLPANSTTSLLINSAHPLHFYYTFGIGGHDRSHGTFSFCEHETYSWNITDDTSTDVRPIQSLDVNYWLPVLVASLIILSTSVLFVIAKRVYSSSWMSVFRSSSVPFSSTNFENDLNIQPDSNNREPSAVSVSSARRGNRINSLDTLRGICIAMMIFVNWGGGQYKIFKHSAWDGLTVADVIFPWFLWVMGVSLVWSLRSQFRNDRSRISVWMLVTRRSLILIALGLILNSAGHGHNDLHLYRIPGVLQRIGLAYFIIATVETCFMNPGGPFQSRICEDIIYGWIQNLVASLLVLSWLIVTFLLDVPHCGQGYLGPGGLAGQGAFEKCTGGAAGYIDRRVFTPDHIYQHPTCEKVYMTKIPYDPEGLLGTLTAAFLVHLGAQAGRMLFCYHHSGRIIRWLIWGIVASICAGILCNFSFGNDGHIPINKNLFSLSYVLLTGGTAFVFLAILYVLIDYYDFWDGAPFKYAGMNAILLYVGHELVREMFPWSWKPIWNSHAELLAMNLWGTCLWLFIAYILWRKNIFLTV